jgi:mRNA interferase MazF
VQRGDFVTVALQGDFGKPRPALVIQADSFADHATVTVCFYQARSLKRRCCA